MPFWAVAIIYSTHEYTKAVGKKIQFCNSLLLWNIYSFPAYWANRINNNHHKKSSIELHFTSRICRYVFNLLYSSLSVAGPGYSVYALKGLLPILSRKSVRLSFTSLSNNLSNIVSGHLIYQCLQILNYCNLSVLFNEKTRLSLLILAKNK
jgi:hypothetical protein